MHTTPARFPLIALAVSAALALAGPATVATASTTAPAPTTYRIIQLSNFSGNADINASGQVAFTEVINGQGRAHFYDGSVIKDIGTLGGAFAAIAAINDAGQIAGTAQTSPTGPSGGAAHAYRWSRATGMIDLAGPGTAFSSAADINGKGWVTGTAQFPPLGRSNAFRWTPSTGLVDLGSLNTNSNGFALNDAGTVVGDSESVEGGFGRLAIRWPQTTPIPLTTFATPFSAALDINNLGQIVGNGSVGPGFVDIAFLWSPQTGIVDLNVPGPTLASAEQINEQGVVIGNTFTPGSSRGFVWTREHGPLVFGTVDVDSTNTADLNKLGQVVGAFNARAYVWTRAEGIVDLNTRIPGAPPDLVLTQGVAISDNGSIVASGNTGLVLLVPRASGYNEAPVAGPIKVTGTPRVNALLSFYAAFTDADPRDTHKATWYWGDGSTSVGTVNARNGAGSASGQHVYRKAGTYTVKLVIVDSRGKYTTVRRTVVVCASGSSISGEGAFLSPSAAYRLGAARPSLATFSFASDAKGTGQALVRFNVGNLAFRSSRVESLLKDGARIEYRGSGTVNGTGNYRFVLGASVGSKSGMGERVRVRISHVKPGSGVEVVDYDNQPGGSAGTGSVVAAGGSTVVGSD